MSAASVTESTVPAQGERPGSTPRAALQSILVQPIPFIAAKAIMVKYHYLHSLPGGTKLAFGTFADGRLLGAITFGVGPYHSYSLVEGAHPDDCLTLTRLWLSETLPRNSESRVISVSLRYLRKYTSLKFVTTYADPAQGHVGTIYQASGWTYTGLSEPTPKYDIGDGIPRQSRTLAHTLGSRSLGYLSKHGIEARVLRQAPKYRYIYFLDKTYRNRLKTAVLPYPKKEINADH